MRVYIITMDDPVQTVSFIKKVVAARKNWIVGVAIAKGDRLTIRKNQSLIGYLSALLLIMGPFHFVRNVLVSLRYKALKKLSRVMPAANKHTLKGWLEQQGIAVKEISSPNSPGFLSYLREQQVDVIINQSQSLLKSKLLSIPRIGTINRHNALLPKNRGRLTPFWVLFKQEKETGVSIHFVNEKLDAGDIIVQKRFEVDAGESFNSLVKKKYEIAPVAMIEALDKLAEGNNTYMLNHEAEATYNSTPGLQDAWRYRINRLSQFIKGSYARSVF